MCAPISIGKSLAGRNVPREDLPAAYYPAMFLAYISAGGRVLAIMRIRFALVFLLAATCAWPQAPAIPDTPAGHTLQAWLEAFNSGDRGRIQAYVEKYDPTGSADRTAAFRAQTGGFDLVAIDKSERLHLEFTVKEKASATTVAGSLDVKDANPAAVSHFSLRAIPPGMAAGDMNMKIDAATRARVIDGAVASLNEFYVYPDTAKKKDGRSPARKPEEGRIRQGDRCSCLCHVADGQPAGRQPRQTPARELFPARAAPGRS
jgi:hypothetical protein